MSEVGVHRALYMGVGQCFVGFSILQGDEAYWWEIPAKLFMQ